MRATHPDKGNHLAAYNLNKPGAEDDAPDATVQLTATGGGIGSILVAYVSLSCRC